MDKMMEISQSKMNFISLWCLTVVSLVTAGVEMQFRKIPTLIEGDIMTDSNDFLDRIVQKDMKQKRWVNGIVPYDMNETIYSVWDEFVIESAMREIEDKTCIKFVKRTNEVDYIYITSYGGCWSFIGRRGSAQELSLKVPDCINQGTVLHELMHALGFWHEHSRADRDHYILVLWENIVEEKEGNFAKHSPEDMNLKLPYDYFSVMHYDGWAFSKKPHLPTLKPMQLGIRLRDLGRAKTIGTLTENDILKVKDLYECSN